MCEITKQEDDFLEEMVKGICTHYDEWLNRTYMWPMMNGRLKVEHGQIVSSYEDKTVGSFASFHDPIQHVETTEPVKRILDWGGIDRNVDQEIADYAYYVNHIAMVNGLVEVLSLAQKHRPEETRRAPGRITNWRISSWSKILAAYDPKRYFIYDSRVAIALSYISLQLGLDVIWSIPTFDLAARDRQAYQNFREDIRRATRRLGPIHRPWTLHTRVYFLYLELLKRLAHNDFIRKAYNNYDTDRTDEFMQKITPRNRTAKLPPTGDEIRDAYERTASQFIGFGKEFQEERTTQAIRAHLEKMLFMMKESILQKYQPGQNKKKKQKKESD